MWTQRPTVVSRITRKTIMSLAGCGGERRFGEELPERENQSADVRTAADSGMTPAISRTKRRVDECGRDRRRRTAEAMNGGAVQYMARSISTRPPSCADPTAWKRAGIAMYALARELSPAPDVRSTPTARLVQGCRCRHYVTFTAQAEAWAGQEVWADFADRIMATAGANDGLAVMVAEAATSLGPGPGDPPGSRCNNYAELMR